MLIFKPKGAASKGAARCLVALVICAGFGASYAADGTITFTGELGGECSVENYTESVDFGRVSTADFAAVADESDASNFSIGVLCTDVETIPSLTFEGEVDTSYTWGFANSGTAEGLAVRIVYSGITVVPGAETPLSAITTADTVQNYTFGARLRRTSDLVMGSIEIPVTFTLTYE